MSYVIHRFVLIHCHWTAQTLFTVNLILTFCVTSNDIYELFQSRDRETFLFVQTQTMPMHWFDNVLAKPAKTLNFHHGTEIAETEEQQQQKGSERGTKTRISLVHSSYASMDNLPMVWIDFYWFSPFLPITLGHGRGRGLCCLFVRVCVISAMPNGFTDFHDCIRPNSILTPTFAAVPFTSFQCHEWHIWNATSAWLL